MNKLVFVGLAVLLFEYHAILEIIKNHLPFLVFPISSKIIFRRINFRIKDIIVSIAMVATFKCIGMSESKIFIKNNSPTPLLTNIFIPIFCFHMLPWKYTLLELEVDTILA